MLKPFTENSDSLTIQGTLEFAGTEISLRFEVQDPQARINDTLLARNGLTDLKRADGLWKTTCFEAFWGEGGQTGYWELNLSATRSAWALYRFDSYRVAQSPHENMDYELLEWTIGKNFMECHLRGKAVLQQPEFSLCAVIRSQSTIHYYALKHAGPKADFHLRSSFLRSDY